MCVSTMKPENKGIPLQHILSSQAVPATWGGPPAIGLFESDNPNIDQPENYPFLKERKIPDVIFGHEYPFQKPGCPRRC